MAASHTWVEDALHEILDYSEDNTVEYLVSMATRATSKEKMKSQLLSSGYLPEKPQSLKLIDRLYETFAKQGTQ